MHELLYRPATKLAELIRSGEITSSELVSASLQRIDELQPRLNAFTHVAHEAALEQAQAIGPNDSRPFAGVPIAIKDNVPVEGMPLTMCSDLFGDFVTPLDSFLVRRLKDAGFVIVGKTALPEMGILPTTESRRNGPTRNPWDPDRTPGGSSGGSAAAVAAGMVPIAHGNDGGGSIRIPAACCGLVGLKPARGRVSPGPAVGHSFLAIDGVLTHTVADTAQALDVLAGYELGDSTWAPPPARPYAQAAQEKPSGLKIAFTTEPALKNAPLDPECERATREAVVLLESLGHHVEEINPPWAGQDLLPEFTRAFGPMVSTITLIGGRIAGREPTEQDVEPLTWELWRHARELDTMSYLEAQGTLETVARVIVSTLAPYDAVLTPALAQRPVPIGEIHGQGPDPWENFNVTGQPAISLPLYQGEDGLPTAVHLIGRPAAEDTLLALATQLEQALPWADRLPEDLAHAEHGSH